MKVNNYVKLTSFKISLKHNIVMQKINSKYKILQILININVKNTIIIFMLNLFFQHCLNNVIIMFNLITREYKDY